MTSTPSKGAGLFSIRTDPDGHSLTVRVIGELDIATAPTLEASLRDAFESDASSIVLVLDGVRFIDSMGLRVLLWAAAHSQENSHRLQMRCGPGAVRRLIEMSTTEDRLLLVA